MFNIHVPKVTKSLWLWIDTALASAYTAQLSFIFCIFNLLLLLADKPYICIAEVIGLMVQCWEKWLTASQTVLPFKETWTGWRAEQSGTL